MADKKSRTKQSGGRSTKRAGEAEKTKESAATGETRQTRVTVARPEDPQTIYSNHVELTVSPWDLTFKFCNIIEINPDDETLLAHERARIAVSPQHAKALARLLERQIKRYEENYGTITDIGRPGELNTEDGEVEN